MKTGLTGLDGLLSAFPLAIEIPAQFSFYVQLFGCGVVMKSESS
jgi:hypothetical protein